MTKRRKQKIVRARRRQALVKALGGRCSLCGQRHALEFDHVDPKTRTWVAAKVGSRDRVVRYEREAAQGLLRLLCRACNLAEEARHAGEGLWT